jgi:proline iminopeptidase
MSIAGFVKELRAIVDGLAIERCHLFGHSFGGVIVGEFALAYPAEVASVVFASCSIDIPRWLNDAERLRGTLPLLSRMVLREGERTGDYTSPQYLQALGEYYERFVYRFREKPNCIAQSERESDSETYTTVWGPNELVVSGVAQGYDLTPRLKEISCPLLFTCGRFDEATPEAHQYFASLVTGASCIVFEESAHHPQLNEETLFLDTIRSFVRS